MAIIVKCNPSNIGAEDIFSSEAVWIYEKCELVAGDETFVWWTREAGVEGLAMRGNLVRMVYKPTPRNLPGASLTIKIKATRPNRTLTKKDLAEYDERYDDVARRPPHPMHGLCRKLLQNSHRKVASLDDDEATYLNTFFAGAATGGKAALVDDRQVLADLAQIQKTKSLTETEKRQLVLARLGQGGFRGLLFDQWQGRCAVTGCRIPDLLRASHIKPWKDADNRERLDQNNGLLLTANLDAAFDRGLISFRDDGAILISRDLPPSAWKQIGIDRAMRIQLTDAHRQYLVFHRENRFRP